VRSLILQALLETGSQVLTLEELTAGVGLNQARINAALEQLLTEGFVVRERDGLRLASRV
jgi:predicted transcriptional regulator